MKVANVGLLYFKLHTSTVGYNLNQQQQQQYNCQTEGY